MNSFIFLYYFLLVKLWEFLKIIPGGQNKVHTEWIAYIVCIPALLDWSRVVLEHFPCAKCGGSWESFPNGIRKLHHWQIPGNQSIHSELCSWLINECLNQITSMSDYYSHIVDKYTVFHGSVHNIVARSMTSPTFWWIYLDSTLAVRTWIRKDSYLSTDQLLKETP